MTDNLASFSLRCLQSFIVAHQRHLKKERKKNNVSSLHTHNEGKCKVITEMTLQRFMFVIQAVSWWGIDHVKCLNINHCLFLVSFSLMTHSAPWRALLRKIWFWKKTADDQVIKLHCFHKFYNTSHCVYQRLHWFSFFTTVTALIAIIFKLICNTAKPLHAHNTQWYSKQTDSLILTVSMVESKDIFPFTPVYIKWFSFQLQWMCWTVLIKMASFI